MEVQSRISGRHGGMRAFAPGLVGLNAEIVVRASAMGEDVQRANQEES
jgi:hypothetical protein